MARGIWTLAARTLRRHPGRTALMCLGLVIGAASITLTVAAGEGARRAVARQIETMIGALDVLFVIQGGTSDRAMAHLESSVTTLRIEDAPAIAAAVPNVRDVGGEQADLSTTIEVDGRSGSTALFGATANWAALRGDSVAAGAFYSAADGEALARVAVIGADLAREYFPGESPLGRRIRVRGLEFEVIGALAANGAQTGGATMGGHQGSSVNIDNVVYIPLQTAQRRVFNRDYLNIIYVKLIDRQRWPETQAAVEALLRQRHHISRDELDDFRVLAPDAMIARVANVNTTLQRALFLVGGLALLIGGVVIANLMFAASASRSREIGTRRAVGASRADVLWQFWAEAILVAVGAALAGTVIAVLVMGVGAHLMGLPLATTWPVLLGTIAATVAIGALAGYLPARRAASLSPSVALRHAE